MKSRFPDFLKRIFWKDPLESSWKSRNELLKESFGKYFYLKKIPGENNVDIHSGIRAVIYVGCYEEFQKTSFKYFHINVC